MMHSTRKSLAGVLLDLQLITPDILQEMEHLQNSTSTKSLEAILVESNMISELDLAKAKEVLYQIPWIDLREVQVDPQITVMIPEKLARRHQLIPLEDKEDGLYIAIANPRNILALDEVQMLVGKKVIPRIAMSSQISERIEQSYRLDQHSTSQMIQQFEEEAMFSEDDVTMVGDGTDEAPVIRLVNSILHQALQNRASDIHIEPTRDETQVRFRIDGVLFPLHTFPPKVHPPFLSRLKIISGLDISQHFIPQDGCITYTYHQRKIDLRISIIPTIYGEKAVLRILHHDTQILSLEELGLLGEDLHAYHRLLEHSHGMILITGPTGSGKSTTLSSSINSLVSPAINISTVEDPVEYKLDHVNQIQVNDKTGLTFARSLRALLRQDPDVLMIGEIRDEETAHIAIRAALTGHLVLSSLHTNDAASTMTRLHNMGIPSYLIASSLIGVIAQRLVRRICPECIEEVDSSQVNWTRIPSKAVHLPKRAFHGRGCLRCNHTGYYGRVGIFEYLLIDDNIRERLHGNVDTKQYLPQKSMLQDGLDKVDLGYTTLHEVLRVII